MTNDTSQYEILLAKYLHRKPSEISRERGGGYYSMVVLEYRDYKYAIGKPGFTENYYGPEVRLSPELSAYRLTPGGTVDDSAMYMALADLNKPEGQSVVANALGSLQAAMNSLEAGETIEAAETIQRVMKSLAVTFGLEKTDEKAKS